MRKELHAVVSALSLSTAALALPGAASSAASGDGRAGPRLFNDDALNQSVTALNDFIQTRYAEDDRMAAINTPAKPDFVTVAEATAALPELHPAMGPTGFGLPVMDGASLNDSVAKFNVELASRGDDLFIRVAQAETGKALQFAAVAADNNLDAALERRWLELTGPPSDFGTRVSNDETLDNQVAAISVHIHDMDMREATLAISPVPLTNDDSFVAFTNAVSFSYN